MSSQSERLDFANLTARAWFSNVVISLLLLGVQAFICIYVLMVFLETPKADRKGRWPYIVFTFLAFTLSAIPISMDAAYLFICLFKSTSPMDFVRLRATGAELSWLIETGQMVPTVLLMIMGDALLLYRCYIVCTDSRWLMALPSLLFIAYIPMGIAAVTPIRAQRPYLYASSVFISVTMNVLITATITVRLLQARRKFTQSLPGLSKGVLSRYTGVAAILIEAALPLSVFGVGYAIVIAVGSAMGGMPGLRARVASEVFAVMYLSFTALSPQMIIFRVTTGRSWTGNFQTSIADSCAAVGSRELSNGLVFTSAREEVERASRTSDVDSDVVDPERRAIVREKA